MEKFIPKEKMSKKAKRRLDLLRRKNWGDISPVTRKSEDKKKYNRKKVRQMYDRYFAEPFEFAQ